MWFINYIFFADGSSRVLAEIPNLSMAEVEAVLGPELYKQASKGPKQVSVKASNGDLYLILGSLSKSLRYGACLELQDGLKFTYLKETRLFKAAGLCTMCRLVKFSGDGNGEPASKLEHGRLLF